MINPRKLLSILLNQLVFAALLVVTNYTAMASSGLSANYVDKEIQVDDKAKYATFGRLYIKETEDFSEAIPAEGAVVTFTLVDGVEFPEAIQGDEPASSDEKGATPVDAAYFNSLVETNNAGSEATCIAYSHNSVTYQVSGVDSFVDRLCFNFGLLIIDSDFSGDVKVMVDAMETSITSGEYVIGRVMGGDNAITALNAKML